MIDIDRFLKVKNLSKKEVAKRMGLSRESLYRILDGNPTLENLKKLSNALEINISELFEQPSGFTALISNNGELKQLNSPSELKKYAEGLD